jgi:Undecaprenyl-phosphate glucose phosphotransferase
MPGVAEREIVLDLARGSSGLSPVGPQWASDTVSRRSLAARAVALACTDFAMTWLLGIISYFSITPSATTSDHPVAEVLGLISVLVVASLWERGLYSPPALLKREVQFCTLSLGWLQAIGLALLVAFCAVTVTDASIHWPGLDRFAGTLRGAWLPAYLGLGVIGLGTARIVYARIAAASVPPNRTVVIGTTSLCKELLERLQNHNGHALNIIGIVDHEPASGDRPEQSPGRFCGLPVIGTVEALVQMIRRDEVDTVLVALPWSNGERTRAVVEQIAMAPVDVYVVPGLDGFAFPARKAPVIAGMPLLLASNRPLGDWQAFVKRFEDLLLGSLLLILTAPAMLAIAALVKFTSRGPVFFRQRRLGFNNRVIEVLKFRTMYTHLADANAREQTLRGDKRVTPCGVWLRRSSLDELPQLLNVLKGDMSLVGPRPHALQTTAGGFPLEDVVPIYSSRHRVKPGITGWAQVNGYRGALDTVDKIVHRVNHDLFYIENWSLGLDLRILWRTACLVLFDDNAF